MFIYKYNMETLPYMDGYVTIMVTHDNDFEVLQYMDTLSYGEISIYGNTIVDVLPYMVTVSIYGCASIYYLNLQEI